MPSSCKYENVFLLAAAFFVLSTCKNKKPPPQKGITHDSLIAKVSKNLPLADSLQLVHDIDSADYYYLFKNKTNIWLSKTLTDTALKWDNFKLTDFAKRDDIKEVSGSPSKALLSDYYMFLQWSPDSTYLIDFGSYGVTMARDKKGQLYIQEGDVDSEVRLYNLRNKTSSRLMFHGPSTSTFGAHWADSAQVALYGLYNPNSTNHPDTVLWLVDVKNNFFRQYKFTRQ